MLFKLSNLNSNLALTLDYVNKALNNSAQMFSKETVVDGNSFLQLIIENKGTPS